MDSGAKNWRLICPPKNWREPVAISEDSIQLLELVKKRLSLAITKDDQQKKIYLGLADSGAAGVPTRGKLRFPSGWAAEVVLDSEAGPSYKAVDPVGAAPLIAAFPDAKISENFHLSEFRPGRDSYKFMRIAPALILALEEIRGKAGLPITVASGYRPPDYNREVGGVSNSCHVDGLAADIYCDGLSTDGLYAICLEVIGYRGGVGYYPKLGFIHVDLRGYEARWSGS